MKNIINNLFKIALVILISTNQSFSQCSGGTNAGALTPTASWQTVAVSGGTYYTVAATAGISYYFSFCATDGGASSYDTQISILDNSGTALGAAFYSDDFCGDDSKVTFACTSTGTYRVLVNKYNCAAQAALGTLAYKTFVPPTCPSGLGTGVINIAALPYTTTGTTVGMVNDCNNATLNSCGHTQDDNGLDVVYTLTPATSGTMTVILTTTATNSSLAIFGGCPLIGNTSTCVGYSYGNGNKTLSFCGMAGTTYYLVIDRRNTTGFTYSFSVSVPVPGSCSVGTVVPVATLPYSSSGRTTCGQLNDVTTANAESCGNSSYYAGEEEVFSFVPLTSGKVQVILSSSAYNTSLFLVEGCPLATYCFGNGSTCIASAYGTAGSKILCGDVIAGRTYYVIADASSGCYPYNISISSPATGFVGSTCANPIIVSALPFQSSGDNTACMVNDYSNSSAASCGTLYESGEDKVYKYVATGPECISITLSGASTNNIGFQVYNGCPDVVGTTCISSAGGAYSGSLSGSINLPSAGTYYIIIDTWAAPASAEFNLYIDTYGGNQDNDLPCDAMELPLGVTVVGDVNCSGGASEPAVPSCWGTPNTLNTVWYYFTAPSSGSILIRTIPGSLLNTQIGVYSGTCGVGLTSIGCNDNATGCASTTTQMSQLSLTGLTAGTVYYIVVDGVGTSTGTFGLVAIEGNQALPTIFGQECSVPLPICNDTVPVGDPGFQSFGNYCDFTGNGANCLESGERGSVWYEIPINANGFLEFTVVPNDWLGAPSTTCTDYDFGLWRIGGPGAVTCNNIFTDSVPLRCNYSWMGITGVFGASNGVAPTAYPGFGPAFMQKLPVLAGETYVLVLSNFSNSLSGFTMLFPSTAPVNYLTSPDTVYWTGSTDNDWFKTANWGGCAIPSCTISGVVLAASANQPVINAANARANSLTIEAGGSLTINSNRNISICGNFNNDGTLNARTNSTIVLNGTGNQYLKGNLTSHNDFVNIQVNKLSGTVFLQNDLDISGNFTFASATSSFNAQGMGIRLAGNFDNSIGGTFTHGSGGVLQFFGTSNQNYNNAGDLEQVVMINTGAGVNLLSDMKIGSSGSLTLTIGKIVTNAFEVNAKNDASSAVTAGSVTSFVQGFLRRKLPTSSSAPRILDFPVGTSTAGYQLMNIFTYNGSDPNINSLRVNFSTWTSGAPGAAGVDPSCPITFNTTSLNNGYWNINPEGSGLADFHMTLYNRTYTNASNANTIMRNETSAWSIPGMATGSCTTSPVTAVLRNGISQTFSAGTTIGFGTAQGTSALPVSLLAFSAEANVNTIECLWSTANEVNNRGFEVQRATDPDLFTTIGWVDGNGTVNVMKSYKFVDDNVQPNQVYYYRLRQVDYDGQFTITKVIAAIIRDNGAVLVEAFPNPYREATTIRYMITRAAMVTIEIMDMSGKLVKRYQQGLQDAGQYTLPFSAKNNGLSTGTYMVSIWCDDQRYQLRLTEND